ncbi:signal recognition particle-docking protein FtsY, partial [Staphylococcus arlettae]|uniref:hypothetical protein n=1 Tax=Staphylococcus arlettae TaxID=29378 RepID=UPI000D4E4DC2
MLKFWKKKPAGTTPEQPADAPASPSVEDNESVAETPAVTPITAVEPAPGPGMDPVASGRVVGEPVPEAPAAPAEPARRGWRDRLSGSGFARGLSSLFVRHPKLDDDLLDELE